MRNNPIIVWRMVLLFGMWSCVSPAWAGSTADELALIEAEHVVELTPEPDLDPPSTSSGPRKEERPE